MYKEAHPRAIMGERAFLQHRQRQRQILAQHISRLLADAAGRERLDAAWDAFDPMVE
jgi:hypothetical protein